MSTDTFVITTKDGRPLTTEELASLDRGIVEARRRRVCEVFDEMAAIAFNIPVEHVLDANGLSCAGYDRDGFKNGYNRDGYNRDGFSKSGYNEDGFDKEGYDRYGFNEDGFNKSGHDEYCYDQFGFDKEGYDRVYGDRRSAGREWYTEQAAKPDTEFCYNRRGQIRQKTTTT